MNAPIWPPLRPLQIETLQKLKHHSHVVLTAPTGVGKSLIYQRYLHENHDHARAVLVTPLVALGRQQVARLQDFGIKTWCGVGDASRVQFPERESGIWVVSPERLLNREDQLFSSWRPNFFIFDEAHCIFEWGTTFRPAFGELALLFERRKIKKSFWCSATLQPSMVKAIQKICGPDTQIQGRFQLPVNLELIRLKKDGAEKLNWLELFLRHHPTESGIIYAATRFLAERLAHFLNTTTRQVWFYHAGMSSEERELLESKISVAHDKGIPFLVVATSAFGMGMDYPRLSFGVVFDPPYSLLQLAQCVGRVGRSGDPAIVFLLWNEGDFIRLRQLTQGKPETENNIIRLDQWYQSHECARRAMEKDFIDTPPSCKIDEGDHSKRSPTINREDENWRSRLSRTLDLQD